jgi:dATP pyrophosphohydrolase
MTAPKRPVSVLVVIYTPAREVLLIRRADHAEFWQSVTGSVDPQDASLAHTAAREVQEETGLSAQPADLQDLTHNTEHVFGLCVPAALPVRLSPREHTHWQWLDWRAAADLCYSPSNAEAILLLPQFLSSQP